MKKIGLSLLLILSLSACVSNSNEELTYQIYKTTYQSILNTTSFQTSSQNFNINVTLTDQGNGNVRYDLFVDEPKISMYDIEILAIVDTGLLVVSEAMMPSIGIFEDAQYHMIPYQINADYGYQKGFNLNGVITSRQLTLKVLVMWKDYFKIRTYKETFKFDISLNG